MPYVEINYNNGAITAFKPAFEEAQLFWNSLVTGGAQPVTVEEEIPLSRCGLEGTIAKGETIPGLRIYASLKEIDGSKGIIASSGACISNGNFPMVGVLQVDTADTAELVRNGNLVDVVKRQIGIVFGIGSQWERRNLVTNPCTGDFGVCRGNPSYTGRFALEAFRELGGQVGEELVVSNTRGVGTWNTHWREDLLVNELMTSTLNMGMPNPFSKISAGALRDLGYSVNMNTAEDFLIPSQFQHPFAAEKVEMFGDILDFDMVDYRTLSVQEESLPGSDSDSSDDDSSVLNIDDDSDLTNEFAGMFGLMIIGFIAMAGMMFYSNKKQTAALKNFAASMKAGSSDNRVGTKNNLYIEP